MPAEGAETLFGNLDENLKHLEGLFGVRIRTSGEELIVEGEAVDRLRASGVRLPIVGVGTAGLIAVATHPDADIVLCASSGTAESSLTPPRRTK